MSRRLPKEAPKVQENIDPHVNIIIERSAGAEQHTHGSQKNKVTYLTVATELVPVQTKLEIVTSH